MLPTLAELYATDTYRMQPKEFANRYLRHPQANHTKYLPRLLLCDLCCSAPLPVSVPFLFRHIVVVVLRRSDEQMIRIDALRIVAGVADLLSFRKRPLVDQVRKAMGVYLPSLSGQLDLPVTHTRTRRYPYPAPAFILLILGIETINQTLVHDLSRHCLGAGSISRYYYYSLLSHFTILALLEFVAVFLAWTIPNPPK